MSAFLVESPLSNVLWIGLEASVILGAAGLLQWLCRHRISAATRHLAWTIVLASLLALPAARGIAPEWPLPVGRTTLPAVDATPAIAIVPEASGVSTAAAQPAASDDARAAGSPRFSAATLALAIYVAGLGGVLLSIVLHRWRTRRLAARADDVADPAWTALLADAAAEMRVQRPVRLLRSRDAVMPMTFGTRTPSILIPATADLWSDDRRRAVLLHELAHVARYDCLTQSVALAVCAIYWPHPGVWWTARRLRAERELACDDRVLTAGAEAQAYAGHLLEIAYSLDSRRAPALAVTMARPGQLEGRLLAALDAARNRQRPGRGSAIALAAVAVTAVVAIAGATPTTSESLNVGARVTERTGTELNPVSEAPEAGQARTTESQQDAQPGTWTLQPSKTAGMVHLRLVEGDSSHGTTVPIATLEGLTGVQLEGPGGPVQFRVTRDAGAFLFEGVLRNGVAGGTFSFTPNPAFPAELVKRGYAKPTAREQYQLARHDVGYAFLDELNKQGYAKPDTAGLVTAGQHGVNTTYLREMGALGYKLGTLPPLIKLRDHGVTPDYVRGMAQEGYDKLPADQIREARDHGVGPDYVRGMREAGYGSLPIDTLINARDHGVTPDYVRALAGGGYRGLPLDQVVRMRDHGITPDYVEGMRQLGYTPSHEDLVKARDHGVTVEYVRGMEAAGYKGTPIDRLINARDHGVTPEYAMGIKTLGYEGLALDDLVRLRDQGLTPERIAAANARAGSKLPIDLLRSLAAGGGLR